MNHRRGFLCFPLDANLSTVLEAGSFACLLLYCSQTNKGRCMVLLLCSSFMSSCDERVLFGLAFSLCVALVLSRFRVL